MGRYKTASLMKAVSLISKPLKKHRYRLSGEAFVIADNILDRQFAVDRPNRSWIMLNIIPHAPSTPVTKLGFFVALYL